MKGKQKRDKRAVSPTETTPLHHKYSSSSSDRRQQQHHEETADGKRYFLPSISSFLFQLIIGTLALTIVALVLNRGGSSSLNDSTKEPTYHIRYNQQPSSSGHPTTTRTPNIPSFSKYSQVQGIGFQIYTGGAPAYYNENDTTTHHHHQHNPECNGQQSYGQVITETSPELQCYLGDTDPLVDVAHRVRIMKQAVETAYHSVSTKNNDPSVLKVFIAPEFFWRGPDGAYAFGDEKIRNDLVCGPICKILHDLQDYIADARFEDWLFLFGTVVAYDVLPDEDTYDYLFYNFAPVYKGYDPKKMDATGKRFLLPKRYVSSSDFLTPRRHLNATLFEELLGDTALQQQQQLDIANNATVRNPFDFSQKRYSDQLWKEYKREVADLGYTMIEYDWLMVDGVSVSLEICFDHQMRTALNTYLGDMVTGRHTFIPSSSDQGLAYTKIPSAQAQISIVASAGMTITADSLALVHNGAMFLQDGLSDEPQATEVGDDGGPEFIGGTEGLRRRVVLTHTDVSFAYEWLDPPQGIALPDETMLEGFFSRKKYPPRVQVYAPVDIALVNYGEAA